MRGSSKFPDQDPIVRRRPESTADSGLTIVAARFLHIRAAIRRGHLFAGENEQSIVRALGIKGGVFGEFPALLIDPLRRHFEEIP
jgi:hypothetical protein